MSENKERWRRYKDSEDNYDKNTTKRLSTGRKFSKSDHDKIAKEEQKVRDEPIRLCQSSCYVSDDSQTFPERESKLR